MAPRTFQELQDELDALGAAEVHFTDTSDEIADAKTQFQVGLAKLEMLERRASR